MPPSGSSPADAAPLGIYVHFPFCSVRCSYCDFATVAGRDDKIEAYLEALMSEISRAMPPSVGDADTIYFGGGTPSRMNESQVTRVLASIRARFVVAADAEITLEGNPESLTAEALRGFRRA